ncbi:MAG: efflux RND transporter periplasmic adaptor subunit [Flavobacteriales bacterium]|nr:efflux RND transporter periplasmic adaptor subunit [Flavobacteriales bacterium]
MIVRSRASAGMLSCSAVRRLRGAEHRRAAPCHPVPAGQRRPAAPLHGRIRIEPAAHRGTTAWHGNHFAEPSKGFWRGTPGPYSITARVSGRIQKLQVRSMFARVTKGQAIASIYSPEPATAQENLLFILEAGPGQFLPTRRHGANCFCSGMTEGQLKHHGPGDHRPHGHHQASAYSGRAIDPGMGNSRSHNFNLRAFSLRRRWH